MGYLIELAHLVGPILHLVLLLLGKKLLHELLLSHLVVLILIAVHFFKINYNN